MRHIIPHPVIFTLILLVVLTQSVFAVGLGNITVKSYLNAPLHAEIKLHSIPASDQHNINVQLASAQAFERANLKRPFDLSQLMFSISYPYTDKSQALITISSAQPIKEPILNFLLELTWPNGKSLREYAVLLDRAPVAEVATKAKSTQVAAVETTLPEVAPIIAPINDKPLLSTKKELPTVHSKPVAEEFERQTADADNSNEINALDFFGSAETVVLDGGKAAVTALVPSTEIITRQDGVKQLVKTTPKPVVKQAKTKVIEKETEIALKKQHMEDALAKKQKLLQELEQKLASKKVELDKTQQPAIEPKTTAPATTPVAKPTELVTTVAKPVTPAEKPVIDNNGIATAKPLTTQAVIAQQPVAEPNKTGTTQTKASNQPLAAIEKPNIDALLHQHGLVDDVIPEKNIPNDSTKVKPAVIAHAEQTTVAPKVAQPAREVATPENTATTQVVKTEPENSAPSINLPNNDWSNTESGFWMGLGAISILLLVGISGFVLNRRNLKNQSQQEFEQLYNNTETPPVAKAEAPKEQVAVTNDSKPRNQDIPDEEELIGVLEDVDVYLSYERYHEAKNLINAALDEYPAEYEFHLKRLEVDAATYDFTALVEHAKILREAVGGKGEIWTQALALISRLEPTEAHKIMQTLGSAVTQNKIETAPNEAEVSRNLSGYQNLIKEAGLELEDLDELTLQSLDNEKNKPQQSAVAPTQEVDTIEKYTDLALESELFDTAQAIKTDKIKDDFSQTNEFYLDFEPDAEQTQDAHLSRSGLDNRLLHQKIVGNDDVKSKLNQTSELYLDLEEELDHKK